MHPKRLILVGVILLLLAACAEAVPTPRPTEVVPTLAPNPTRNPAGDVQNGATLFVTWRCADCHGANAGGRIGPSLAGTTLSLEQFTLAIRQTRPPKPAFSETELSAADVRDLYAWVSSLEPSVEASPGVALGEGEILGMTLYTSSGCDACHGAFAQGGPEASALAGYAGDANAFLEALDSTTADVPEHSLETLDRDLMRRLHRWLQEGANPDSGC